jgi:hypothetical protein
LSNAGRTDFLSGKYIFAFIPANDGRSGKRPVHP